MTRARWKNTFEGVLLIGLLAVSANAVGLTGCSGLNTGSGGQSSNSIYMTNGKCQDSCQGYAFAITQWQNCWCSNMAPGDTTDSGSCNQKCPGYPDESCGNQQQGLYGYIALGKAPMGTMGAGGSGGGGGGGGSSAGGANGGKPIAPASTVVIAPSSQPQTVVQVSTQVVCVNNHPIITVSSLTPEYSRRLLRHHHRHHFRRHRRPLPQHRLQLYHP